MPSSEANPRPAFGEMFRKWVTGPQVAMATLTCLVVAIGLTYIPLSRRDMPADGDTVAAPEAPAATGTLAENVVQEAQARMPASQREQAPSQGASEPRYAAAEAALPAEERGDRFGISGEPPEATNAMPAPSVAAIVPSPPVPAPTMSMDSLAARDEEAEIDDGRLARYAASAEASGYGATPADAPRVEATPAPAAPAAPTTSTTAPSAQAQAAARTPTATGQAAAPARAVDPTATLAQARSLRSSGACGAATNVYQRFLSEAGTSHPQRGPAMLELADCLQRTGRTGVARQTLEQAQGVPSVAARARRELEQTTEERAPASRSRPAAAPRSSEQMDNAYRSAD